MKNPESLDWYRFAQMDRMSAITLNDYAYPKPLEIICYHCEQCAEKMLKGFLIANSISAPRSHDLPLLCDMCIEQDERFTELSDICEFLTSYGTQPRYPNEIEVSDEDTTRALQYIHTIADFFDRCGIETGLTRENVKI